MKTHGSEWSLVLLRPVDYMFGKRFIFRTPKCPQEIGILWRCFMFCGWGFILIISIFYLYSSKFPADMFLVVESFSKTYLRYSFEPHRCQCLFSCFCNNKSLKYKHVWILLLSVQMVMNKLKVSWNISIPIQIQNEIVSLVSTFSQ